MGSRMSSTRNHETIERHINVNGLAVIVRAIFCTPAGGWFWTARADDGEAAPSWSASGSTPWYSAEAAHEAAAAKAARLLA